MPTRCVRPDSERAAFLNDIHVPFHDPAAVEVALACTRWYKPDVLFLVGDIIDAYSVSRFCKDPQRVLSLQDELNQAKKLLGKLRSACKHARMVYLQGNHEDRVRKYLWEAPEISVLDNLQLPALLGLDDLGIECHSYQEQLTWHGLLIEHGDRVSKHSGATARSMLEARGVSGLSGHVHRLAAHYRTNNSGVHVWYENGCLCSLRPGYLVGVPNWQQGMSVAHAVENHHRFHLTQLPILNGKLYFEGRSWEAA